MEHKYEVEFWNGQNDFYQPSKDPNLHDVARFFDDSITSLRELSDCDNLIQLNSLLGNWGKIEGENLLGRLRFTKNGNHVVDVWLTFAYPLTGDSHSEYHLNLALSNYDEGDQDNVDSYHNELKKVHKSLGDFEKEGKQPDLSLEIEDYGDYSCGSD